MELREIEVGIRIDLVEGLFFTGIEVVNGLINCGGVVKSIEPGGALMRKLGEDGDDVQMTLSGCSIKVVIDDAAVESTPQTLEHKRLFEEGTALIKPYMHIDDRESKSPDLDVANEELHRGIELLNQALAINRGNWSAHWIIGKAYQVLKDAEQACDSFGMAWTLHKGNKDVAREYMLECLNLGRAQKAIAASRHAMSLDPEDVGLVANHALALLIGAKLEEANTVIDKALTMDPDDKITRNLQRMIREVQSGQRPQPTKFSDLNA